MSPAESLVELCPWCTDPTPAARGRYFCEPHLEEYEARARREREAEAERNRGAWLDDIGVPRAQQGFAFATLDETRCVELVRAYEPRVAGGRALVLLGPTGVGKTAAAVALLNALLPVFQTRMVYVLGLTRQLRGPRRGPRSLRARAAPRPR